MSLVTTTVDVAARTDVGKLRSVNQDACLLTDLTQKNSSAANLRFTLGAAGSVLIVADGLGGGSRGEVASQETVNTIYEFLAKLPVPESFIAFQEGVHEAVLRAHLHIQSYARTGQALRMGTTLTCAGLWSNQLLTAQIGDSRAYLLRQGDLVQITQDQSLVGQLVQSGFVTIEEARVHPRRNVVLQSIGQSDELSVAFTQHELKDGDLLLLCSDGLHGLVEHSFLEAALTQSLPSAIIAQNLVDAANANGGNDNITVVVAKIAMDK
jgi:PPM family protein phosphatase